MERTAWTDERIDDLVDRLDKNMQGLREEMQRGFGRMDDQFLELRAEMATMGRQMTSAALGLSGTFAAALVAVVVQAFL